MKDSFRSNLSSYRDLKTKSTESTLLHSYKQLKVKNLTRIKRYMSESKNEVTEDDYCQYFPERPIVLAKN